MKSSTTTLEKELLKSQNEIQILRNEIASLKEQLSWFTKQIFGKKSEKVIVENPNQLLLLDLETPQASVVKEQEISSYKRHTTNKNNAQKITFPDTLPVERIIFDLKEEEKTCSQSGKQLVKIGEDVTQKLAIRPGSYYIKEIIRPKYASIDENGEKTVIAAEVNSFLSKCKADESLLADILVKKFADHLPLYRQSEMLSRERIFISRQILSQWVVKCGLTLKPIHDAIRRSILESNNIFVDEVPVDMLSPGNGSTKQTYMWVLSGGKDANPSYRVYNFKPNRRHEHAEEILKGYQGVLHSDKYGAYESLASKKIFTWCPCWSHIRRKFYEAEGGDPNFRNTVLRKIKYLFMFERVAWARSEEERLKIRQQKEIPIIDELIHLIKTRLVHGKVLAKSKFREALGYFCSLIPYLKNYTQHPFARLDNNVVERAVRPLALGRKNWLFLGSEEGGEAAGIILSLIQTCRHLKINPNTYLEDVMRKLMAHSNQKIDELLPDRWLKSFALSIV